MQGLNNACRWQRECAKRRGDVNRLSIPIQNTHQYTNVHVRLHPMLPCSIWSTGLFRFCCIRALLSRGCRDIEPWQFARDVLNEDLATSAGTASATLRSPK